MHCAVFVSPDPLSGIGKMHPLTLPVTLSLKSTFPEGFDPATDALNVTMSPGLLGLSELVSVVLVGSSKALALAVKNHREETRSSRLEERLSNSRSI